jgi:hypothetical protein
MCIAARPEFFPTLWSELHLELPADVRQCTAKPDAMTLKRAVLGDIRRIPGKFSFR